MPNLPEFLLLDHSAGSLSGDAKKISKLCCDGDENALSRLPTNVTGTTAVYIPKWNALVFIGTV